MQIVRKIMDNKTFKSSFLIGLIFLIIFILVGNNIFSIGALINRFNPCDDNILNSSLLHCYSIYDIYSGIAFGVISFVSFLVAIITAIYLSIKKAIK